VGARELTSEVESQKQWKGSCLWIWRNCGIAPMMVVWLEPGGFGSSSMKRAGPHAYGLGVGNFQSHLCLGPPH
jgi:hypothetical protein